MLGRVVAGLPINEIGFAELPPHFINNAYFQVLNNDYFPYYNSYPDKFKELMPYLLSSVVYHRNYLINTLPNQHPLFKSRFWINNWHMKFSESVVTGFI